MTLPDDRREVNPYASPTTPPEPPAADVHYELRRELRAVRQLALWLGVIWIIIGGGMVAFAAAMFFIPNADPLQILPIAGTIGAVGLVWTTLGILTCCKNIAAMYLGLVLTYFHLAAAAVSFVICPVLILLAMLLHAHSVIYWAGVLRRKGVPLATRPQDIETRLKLPS